MKNKGVGDCFFCVCSTVEQTKGLAHASLVRRVCCALTYVCTYVKVRGHPDNNLKLLVGWAGPPSLYLSIPGMTNKHRYIQLCHMVSEAGMYVLMTLYTD